ncbi:lebercilin-like isoform X2 [Anneissia japonica]|uniref:lebercilin-like isoform X2 n=1 Tax=Anneissia japonica TaxID=1529436 RepID=UPI001425908B|nr:lebercilin-like isoform X2 [Anneissia japonica]
MRMTKYGGVDTFFDEEPHDSPVLKGEYTTVASPVREKTLINSPIHSPLNMSKSKGSRSYYSDSRSGSRSPRSVSPRDRNSYSDSFDSEDSAQDSRPSSARRTKNVSRKSKATVHKRTSSNYSRDSRITNATSSGYGKTRRTYTGQSKGRASSIQGNVTPRNATEVTKRMLSAKGHTINRLRSENEEIKIKYEESVREIRLLKQLQRKQERALNKFEGEESELPELLRNHSAELDSLHQRVRKYKEKDRSKDKQLQEQHDELCRLQKEMKKMKKLAGDKHLLERDALQQKLSIQSEQLSDKEKRIIDLERYVENIRKNQSHQFNDVKNKEHDLKGQISALQMENERILVQLREKEKELDIRNIYSNRVIKPPTKLRSTKSPTSPRGIMLDKSTTTDSLIQSPHPPGTPKRTSSAEVRQQITEKKTVVVEKEKKELNEHELILQQLDLGIQAKENKDEGDDVMKGLALAKQRREERLKNEQEEKRKEEQLLREKEEEERLKRKEEERLRLKKIKEDEEANKEKERVAKGGAKSFKPNSLPTTVRADSEDEGNILYFGSKPKSKQAEYAVNSVRGLQKYSNERSGSADKDNRSFGGNKVFGEPSKKSSHNATVLPTNGNHATSVNKEQTERLNKEKEDARRKKEELLAKMREIDQKSEKPDSGRSRKSYKFTNPVENLHNGLPSRGLGTTGSSSNDEEDLAFGSYAPTFSKGSSSKKQDKSLANGHANQKKSDLLSNLFSKGDTEKPNTSSDNDDAFNFGTKAKPVKDKAAFPWDSEAENSKGTGAKTGRRAQEVNSLFGQNSSKAPYIGKLAVNEVDDFDDDLEEVIL